MQLAIIVVSAFENLQCLHRYLPEFKLVNSNQRPIDTKVVLHVNISDQQKTIQYASLLKLYNYTTKAIIIQDDSQIDFQSILSQLKCFDINSIIVGKNNLLNDAFMQPVIKELTDIKSIETVPVVPTFSVIPAGDIKDNNDRKRGIHGREIHEGNVFSQYLQSSPMLFGRDGHNIWMGDMYRGASAFLVLGGPSFASIDKSKLTKPGILTMSVNNSPKTFRPNMWVSVDDPTHFLKSVWLDPKITKFVPFSHSEKPIFDSETWQVMDTKVGQCPNVWYFKRNEHFRANQYLFEDTINWGNHKDHGGGRSVMLAAVRILFYLGVRKIYLLGCDFKMDENTKYHFDQDRAEGSIKGNNSTYKLLAARFQELKPIFEANNFHIYNCNPESGLKVFPFVSFDDAIKSVTAQFPADATKERTAGLYERTAKKKGKSKDGPK